MFFLFLNVEPINNYRTVTVFSRHFDFFRQQKDEGLKDSLQSINQLGGWLVERLTSLTTSTSGDNYGLWHSLLQVSLWGNK